MCFDFQITDLTNLNIPQQFINGSGNVTVPVADRGLQLSSSLQQVNEINSITIDGVLSLNVPITPLTDSLFRSYFDTDQPNFLSKPLACRLMQQSEPLKQRFCYPTLRNEESKIYEVQLTYDKDHWIKIAANTKVKDALDWGTFTLNRTNIENSWKHYDSQSVNNPAFSFLPAWYGGTYGDGNETVSSDFRPFINIPVLLDQALCKFGFKLESQILSNPLFRYTNAYLLKADYGQNGNLDIYKFKAGTVTTIALNPDPFFGVDMPGPAYEIPLSEGFDTSNMFQYSAAYATGFSRYNGNVNIIDSLKIKYHFAVSSVSSYSGSEEDYAEENSILEQALYFEIRTINENGVEEISHSENKVVVSTKGTYQGTITLDNVSSQSANTVVVVPRFTIKCDALIYKIEFFNDPKEFKYVENDVINIANEIDPDITVLDVLKATLHLFAGKLDTQHITRTLGIFTSDTTTVQGELVQGYNLNEAERLDKIVVNSLISKNNQPQLERYQEYKYFNESDSAFKRNEQFEDALTATIDLGDNYKEKTKTRKNPLFEATILSDDNPFSNTSTFITGRMYLPSLAPSENKVNIKVGKRILIFGWCGQRSIDIEAFNYERYGSVVFAKESNTDKKVYQSFPLGYLDLSLHPETVFEQMPGQPSNFVTGLNLNYNNLYNLFYRGHLSEYASPIHIVRALAPVDTFYYLNYRKSLRFDYKGQSYNLKPIQATTDVCTNDIEFTMIGDLKGDCTNPITIGPPTGVCNNFPKIIVAYDNISGCQNFTEVGQHSSIIDSITWEMRYANPDGTFTNVSWVNFGSGPNAQFCNATGLYQVRALIDYVGDCESRESSLIINPCGNEPSVFWDLYINTNGDQCFKATIIGTFAITILSKSLFYQVGNGPVTIYNEGQEICLTGETGQIDVCITGTIDYEGDCADSEINDCIQFPIENPDCGQTTLQVECVQGSTPDCYTFTTTGNLAAGATASLILIQYRCGNSGDVFLWTDGEEVCCPNGDLQARLVVIYCNNICPVYCSAWSECNSSCTATVSVSNDCCVLTATLSNCTNPQLQWQYADLGSSTWTNIVGATSDQLNIFEHFPEDNKKYRLQAICDLCGVIYGPETTIEPSVNISELNCELTAIVANLDCITPVTYTWQKSLDSGANWTVVDSGQGLSVIQADSDAVYRVIISYNGCTRTSNNLTANCNTCDDVNVSIVKNGCCELAVGTLAGTNPIYQWQEFIGSWVDITGETNSTLSLTDNGTFRLCIIVDECPDPTYSNSIIVAYAANINIDQPNCLLSINDNSDCGPVTIQWQQFNTVTSNWDNVSTATTYTVDEDAVYRAIIVFGGCITIITDPINVNGCDTCNPTVIIQLDGCEITIGTLTGCDGATFELEKYDDATTSWIGTGITALPYTTVEDVTYRLAVTCPCGIFYSNEVISTGCCIQNATIVEDDCLVFSTSGFSTSGGANYIWERSTDYDSITGIGTWNTYQTGSIFISISDNACYRLRVPNGIPCPYLSNVVCADCGSGCSGILVVGQSGCDFIVSTNPCGAGNNDSWFFEKENGSTWNIIQQGTGLPPSTIMVTSNGNYRLRTTCNNGCQYTSAVQTFTTCGTTSNCDSELSVNVVNCTIVATVTNCPNPTYTFLFNGNTVYTGPNNAITVDNDGTYTVQVTGCPDCTILTQNIVVSGCSASAQCNCGLTIGVNNCNEFVSIENNCSGWSGAWQYSTDGVSGWSNISGDVTTFNAANNGFYRKIKTKAGCPTETSNIIQITCIATCSPSLTITTIDNGCKIRADWTGCENITFLQWGRAATNPNNNCGTCGGYSAGTGVEGTVEQTVINPDGSGYSILIPEAGSTCYRLIINCCSSVGFQSACLYWDQSNCIQQRCCVQFQNVAGNTTEPFGPYYMESVIFNGVQYNATEIQMPVTGYTTVNGVLFEDTFKDFLNGLSIPNVTFNHPTALQQGLIIANGSNNKVNNSVTVYDSIGDTYAIVYTYKFTGANGNGNVSRRFTITESGATVTTYDFDGTTVIYNGPVGGSSGYWFNGPLCSTCP